MRSLLVWLMVLFCCTFSAPSGAAPCRPAELFATDNTDPLFEAQATATIALGGATVTGSTPLDGVYWSSALQRNTQEHSREFHLCAADGSLHTAAEALRRQFDQEAVLTFDYERAPGEDAIIIAVPDVDVARFGDALAADPVARDRIRGGSVTTTDHTLILVAGNDDRDVARRLVGAAGGNWAAATISYGKREFVE
ncbi:hypothetical protein [Mycobacterium sp. IEC1808]|uniref:hypothetical protein n=1 Tax=Mycobacterium sp. IEC1808 TaxID=1743230 RepID=UPI001F4EE9D3|nr:hypothetical protein [Mycobacterium sp. IEC1808]